MDGVPDFYAVLGTDMRIVYSNRTFAETFLSGEPGPGSALTLWDIDDRRWDTPEMRHLLEGPHAAGVVRTGSLQRAHPVLGPQRIGVRASWRRPPGEDADVIVLRACDSSEQDQSVRTTEVSTVTVCGSPATSSRAVGCTEASTPSSATTDTV